MKIEEAAREFSVNQVGIFTFSIVSGNAVQSTGFFDTTLPPIQKLFNPAWYFIFFILILCIFFHDSLRDNLV